MPELPEVETTCRGLSPLLTQTTISCVRVRQPRLRWMVPEGLATLLPGATIIGVTRRAKYLLLDTDRGTVIVHLGMSGSLRLVPEAMAPGTHDHVDLVLQTGHCLRFRDPRRFGAILWTDQAPWQHPLLSALGPEPLGAEFNGQWLYQKAGARSTAVKSFIMDSHVVVGLGNIYANEALFAAGIHPARAANRISLQRYRGLASAIKQVLNEAIVAGGTTLRDFADGTGRPGYFQHRLRVYKRNGGACVQCGILLRQRTIAQRSTFFCVHCQR